MNSKNRKGNHPPARGQKRRDFVQRSVTRVAEEDQGRADAAGVPRHALVLGQVKNVCKSFRKTGSCKYGDACKFNHIRLIPTASSALGDVAGGREVSDDHKEEKNSASDESSRASLDPQVEEDWLALLEGPENDELAPAPPTPNSILSGASSGDPMPSGSLRHFAGREDWVDGWSVITAQVKKRRPWFWALALAPAVALGTAAATRLFGWSTQVALASAAAAVCGGLCALSNAVKLKPDLTEELPAQEALLDPTLLWIRHPDQVVERRSWSRVLRSSMFLAGQQFRADFGFQDTVEVGVVLTQTFTHHEDLDVRQSVRRASMIVRQPVEYCSHIQVLHSSIHPSRFVSCPELTAIARTAILDTPQEHRRSVAISNLKRVSLLNIPSRWHDSLLYGSAHLAEIENRYVDTLTSRVDLAGGDSTPVPLVALFVAQAIGLATMYFLRNRLSMTAMGSKLFPPSIWRCSGGPCKCR